MNFHSWRHIGQMWLVCCECSHFMMQCMWKQCEHCPQTGTRRYETTLVARSINFSSTSTSAPARREPELRDATRTWRRGGSVCGRTVRLSRVHAHRYAVGTREKGGRGRLPLCQPRCLRPARVDRYRAPSRRHFTREGSSPYALPTLLRIMRVSGFRARPREISFFSSPFFVS